VQGGGANGFLPMFRGGEPLIAPTLGDAGDLGHVVRLPDNYQLASNTSNEHGL
jgi:hypothetical protein